MLTGKPAFTGETLTDLISGIIRIEPDWSALPANTPPGLQSVVRRCLDKDRRRRFHAIGDVRIALEEGQNVPAAVPVARLKARERISWAIAAIVLAAIGVLLGARYFSPRPAELLASRFLMEFPPDAPLGGAAADPFPSVSPDGRYVAFRSASGVVVAGANLWLRPVGSLNAQPIAGTEGIISFPFWSADSRWMAHASSESGRNEIYVQPFPPSGGKWQVSVDGGEYVYWRGDGRELIFGTVDGKIMSADVKLGATFEAGVPRQLFQLPGRQAGERFAITADAQRFLVPLIPQGIDRPALTTVLNWTADIRK